MEEVGPNRLSRYCFAFLVSSSLISARFPFSIFFFLLSLGLSFNLVYVFISPIPFSFRLRFFLFAFESILLNKH